MNPKDFIEQAKDYADIADASYAMLHYIDNNEVFDPRDDEFRAKIPAFKPIERWIYADGIKLGYEIQDKHLKDERIKNFIEKNKRELRQPTAYALSIEARFSKNMTINMPKYDNPSKLEPKLINNKIQNLIYTDKKSNKQEIKVSVNKERAIQDKNTFHLSPRTKYFTSRFEILHHQPNTSISGYSHTLFKDHLAKDSNDRYILAFRGTELRGVEFFKDAVLTDGSIALGVAIPQIISLVKFKNEVLETIKKDIGDSNYQLNVIGHSLGGHLAQSFCLCHKKESIHKLYTFNAPGFGGALATAINIFLRIIRLIFKLLVRGVQKLLSLMGFRRKVIDKCIKTCNPNDALENYVEYADTLKQEIGEEETNNLATRAKELSKAHTKIEVHHIETIKKPLPTEESFSRDIRQTLEPSISIISDLGYKYGLNILDKFDYKNTQRLHLLYVGELEECYESKSHLLESILQITYFYHYLLQSPSNQTKPQLSQSIEKTLEYLNSYSKLLMDLVYGNKLIKNTTAITKTNSKDNYLSVYQKEILHIFINDPKKIAQEYQYDFNKETEAIQTADITTKKLTKNDTINVFLLLLALGIYTRMLDKNDMENLLKAS